MNVLPHFDHEDRFPGQTVCGIDEAGRGPLAGPVVAAAVIIPAEMRGAAWVTDLRDSKLLKPVQREALHQKIAAACPYGAGQASPAEIDGVNILQATFLAMNRAMSNMAERWPAVDPATLVRLVDGNRRPAGMAGEIVTIVKGDQVSCSIAAASIIAKVTRDRIMAELCREHPAYGFGRHKGYGTKQHLTALAVHGPCSAHRMSFGPIKIYL